MTCPPAIERPGRDKKVTKDAYTVPSSYTDTYQRPDAGWRHRGGAASVRPSKLWHAYGTSAVPCGVFYELISR
jgi:hypothetical protein